ncbi:AbrB/MazE/SpoVT family DNA-binding domain-containing protein [Saccharolobus islandicus]|uniref:Transcriptional regulator, AbrB family n=2 Tax=Saccharolobus islandicus TaxID=43080 RepID=C4KKM5_SACI6|nr:AbrB/MazE/SpoVT family DNA-binding domain-containing protein [Sulfolobus islandicus]ACP39018.1 transcriptional regulator, AbrB family [Sulfolobus islandicus M.14.25]ACR42887.1 transcriptional regulator, AbrB family [Sulfolobus islandicus M.16.4]
MIKSTPASARSKINIKEGDILEVYLNGDEIVLRKVKTERPRIRLGNKLSLGDIEEAIERGEGNS